MSFEMLLTFNIFLLIVKIVITRYLIVFKKIIKIVFIRCYKVFVKNSFKMFNLKKRICFSRKTAPILVSILRFPID